MVKVKGPSWREARRDGDGPTGVARTRDLPWFNDQTTTRYTPLGGKRCFDGASMRAGPNRRQLGAVGWPCHLPLEGETSFVRR